MEKIIYTKREIEGVALRLLKIMPKHSIVCLQGDMGAGKTTLIKALVKHLEGKEQGNSPTFGIVNEYQNAQGQLLAYHFDFYRLNDPGEALDLGFEDYLRGNAWVFIEWPEKLGDFLPEQCFHLNIKILNPITRELSLL